MMDTALETRATELRDAEEAFAIATVVRAVNATAAKPGAKALVRADGVIEMGWIGGGCVRHAIGQAAQDAVADGQPRLISLRPEDLLDAEGVKSGEERDGQRFARNGCPSKGSMDIFIEPVIPHPVLTIFGESPVALALAEMAEMLDYRLSATVPAKTAAPKVHVNAPHFIVVATQGADDLDALRKALDTPAEYRAFVGSKKKFSALSEKLVADGVNSSIVQTVSAPAGLNISAITPQEIALSILAEITNRRRSSQRLSAP